MSNSSDTRASSFANLGRTIEPSHANALDKVMRVVKRAQKRLAPELQKRGEHVNQAGEEDEPGGEVRRGRVHGLPLKVGV